MQGEWPQRAGAVEWFAGEETTDRSGEACEIEATGAHPP